MAPTDSINPDQQPTIALKIASGGTCIDPRRGTRYPSSMHVQVSAQASSDVARNGPGTPRDTLARCRLIFGMGRA